MKANIEIVLVAVALGAVLWAIPPAKQAPKQVAPQQVAPLPAVSARSIGAIGAPSAYLDPAADPRLGRWIPITDLNHPVVRAQQRELERIRQLPY